MQKFFQNQKIPIVIFIITFAVFSIFVLFNMIPFEELREKNPNVNRLRIIYSDEPFYLAQTSAIAFHQSVYIEDHFLGPELDPYMNKSTWNESWRDPSRWHVIQRDDGHFISYHAPGLPYLLVPGYYLAGITGALITMAVSTSLVSVFIFKFLHKLTSTRIAFTTTLVFSFSTILLINATRITPDILAELFVILPLYLIFEKRASNYYMAAAGALLGYGIFLKISFILVDIVLIPLLVYILISKKIPKKNFGYFIVFFVFVTLLWGVNNLFLWNEWIDPLTLSLIEDPSGHAGQEKGPLYASYLVEYFFGRDHSLFVASPLVLLFALGIGSLYYKNRLLLVTIACVSVSLIFGHMFIQPSVTTGADFQFRYLMPLVPLLAIPFGLAIQKYSKSIIFKILFAPLFVISFILAMAFSYFRLSVTSHFPEKAQIFNSVYLGVEEIFPIWGPEIHFESGLPLPHEPLNLINEIYLIVIMILICLGIIISFRNNKN